MTKKAKRTNQSARTVEEGLLYLGQFFPMDLLSKYKSDDVSEIVNIVRLIKKDGKVRVKHLSEKRQTGFKHRETLRGFMRRLVEDGLLFSLDDSEGGTRATFYFANSENFYEPKRLVELLPKDEVDRIAAHVGEKPLSLDVITERAYGDRPSQPTFIVQTVLDRFVAHGLMEEVGGGYSLTDRGLHFGADVAAIEHLDDAELEREVLVKKYTSSPDPKKLTREYLTPVIASDLAARRSGSFDLTQEFADKKSISLRLFSEILYGNQFTHMKGLNASIDEMAKHPPDITLVTGLVQGEFAARQKSKQRILASLEGLDRVSHQLTAAGNLLNDFEQVTGKHVFYTFGDDDDSIADDFALQMQQAEGKSGWQISPMRVSRGKSLENRLWYKEYEIKRALQLRIMLPYQYRVGRSILSADEVNAKIGKRKNEYRLIVEILAHVRRLNGWERALKERPWPPEYEKIVDLDALRGDIGEKRVITPDTLSLFIPGQNRYDARKPKPREILFVHNADFSDVTAYTDASRSLAESVKQRLASGDIADVPFMTVSGHAEELNVFFDDGDAHGSGHWYMTLPGLQNPMQEAEFKMLAQYRGALTAKSRRQLRSRKRQTVPGDVEVELLADGRVRMRFVNDTMRRVIAAERDKPEKREVIAYVADTQIGSITACPEFAAKYLDYALYDRRADVAVFNGDMIHGNNYPQHYAESCMDRLISVNNQKQFFLRLMGPLIGDSPALRLISTLLGNHEWNTFGRHLTGTNDAEFFESYVRGIIDERERQAVVSLLKTVLNPTMVRFADNVSSPTNGARVAWPFFVLESCGFKLAFSHLWRLFGGGGGHPIEKQRRWITGMANAAKGIDFMFGGHHHTLGVCQHAGKICVQVPAMASQSGYEMMLALAPTTMAALIEVSNRTGVTIEWVTWEYLMHGYECKSPFLKGKDEQLLRPQRGTAAFDKGRLSPFVEEIIDEVNKPLLLPV